MIYESLIQKKIQSELMNIEIFVVRKWEDIFTQ